MGTISNLALRATDLVSPVADMLGGFLRAVHTIGIHSDPFSQESCLVSQPNTSAKDFNSSTTASPMVEPIKRKYVD